MDNNFLHDRLIKLMNPGNGVNTEEYRELKHRLDSSSILYSLNENIPDDSMFTYVSDAVSNVDFDGNTDRFMYDLERTKEQFDLNFREKRVIHSKHRKSVFFIADAVPGNMMKIAELYSMSSDLKQWQTVDVNVISGSIENGMKIYLRNEYTFSIFEVNPDNYMLINEVIGYCVPFSIVKIGELPISEFRTLEEVYAYLALIEQQQKQREEVEKVAEEQLKRTYKGITFNSISEMENIIGIENDTKEFCSNLENISHTNLWEKRESISRLTAVIFGQYTDIILGAMEQKEQLEKAEYENQINQADIDGIMSIQTRINGEHYTNSTMIYLQDMINRQRFACEKKILDTDMENYKNISREELKSLLEKIYAYNFNPSLTAQYADMINNQNDYLENKELESLCSLNDEKDIPGLIELRTFITNGQFKEQIFIPFINQIDSRIEFLHIRNMELICVNINEANRNDLEKIRRDIDAEECRLEVKNRFYEMIFNQTEVLDYNDLQVLTQNLEEKNLEELEELYNKLLTGNFNPKFIKRFLYNVRLQLEKEQQATTLRKIENIYTISCRDVEQLGQELSECGYSYRVSAVASKMIKDRLFELHIQDLTAMCNNFDGLNDEETSQMIAMAYEKNVSEECRQIYLQRLFARQKNIGLIRVSSIACYLNQVMTKYGIVIPDIKIAAFSQDYNSDRIKTMYNITDPYEIPVFYIDNNSNFAVTKKACYCSSTNGPTMINLVDIAGFSTYKKLLFEGIAINLINGGIIQVTGTLNKKILPQIIGILNEFVPNVNNEQIIGMYEPIKLHVDNFDLDEYVCKERAYELNGEYIVDNFLNSFMANEVFFGLKQAVKTMRNDKWMNTRTKLRDNMGIFDNSVVVWSYDNTLLKSAKEGVALGNDTFYMKKSGQNLISIPFSEIFNVTFDESNRGFYIETLDNQVILVDLITMPADRMKVFVSLLADYIRGIQLINYLGGSIEINVSYGAEKTDEIQNESEPVTEPAKEEETEWMFCTNCGNKIRKGKNFCSYCGNKLI